MELPVESAAPSPEPPRGPWLQSVAGVFVQALGSGAVVCGLVVPLPGSSGYAFTLTGILAMLAGVRMWRTAFHPPTRATRALLGVAGLSGVALAAGVASAVVSLSRDVVLVPRNVADLSISLPEGELRISESYEIGRLRIERPDGDHRPTVTITWQPGAIQDPSEFAAEAKRLATDFDPGLRMVGPLPVAVPPGRGILDSQSLELDDGSTKLFVTSLDCNARRFTVAVAGRPGAARGTHRRMLASASCARTSRQALSQLPALVGLPAGWGEVIFSATRLRLAGPEGFVEVAWHRPRAETADVRHAVQSMLGADAAGVTVSESSAPSGAQDARPVWKLAGRLEGSPVTGWATGWSCGPGRADLLAVAALSEPNDRVLDALLGARCAKPDELPIFYPKFLPGN